jgi:hypothetical protein
VSAVGTHAAVAAWMRCSSVRPFSLEEPPMQNHEATDVSCSRSAQAAATTSIEHRGPSERAHCQRCPVRFVGRACDEEQPRDEEGGGGEWPDERIGDERQRKSYLPQKDRTGGLVRGAFSGEGAVVVVV